LPLLDVFEVRAFFFDVGTLQLLNASFGSLQHNPSGGFSPASSSVQQQN
jgi:hypothetical protein